MARRLPEVEDGRSYGVKVLRVRGSFLATLAQDGRSMVVKAGRDERAALCAQRPETFAPNSDDAGDPTMVVRLKTAEPSELWPVLVSSWRRSAPSTLVASHDIQP
ncbi:MAG: MmcQ/YjbR family DNA-binding protein [Acidimicrobiales bacterium]